MKKTIKFPVGEDIFKNLILSESYYIDKTNFIVDLLACNPKVLLLTRPRRFGKTLLLSTLKEFFSIDGKKELFDNLEITNHQDICSKWMNKNPVIFVSFKGIEGETFEKSYDKLKRCIANLARNFLDIFEESNSTIKLNRHDLIDIETLTSPENKNISESLICYSLQLLCKLYYMLYQKNVIILIDEYDVPLAKAEKFGYYDKYINIIRDILNNALKTNEYLNFAVLTGCLKISKESIFTGLNNLICADISFNFFTDCCGFTNYDIDRILKDTKLEKYKDNIKEWYDGYIFGDNSEIYCPWDVINYINFLYLNKISIAKNYWKNSSDNDIIKKFIYTIDDKDRILFDNLFNNKYILVDYIDTITYEDLKIPSFIWTYLYHTGYLTKLSAQKMITYNLQNEENKIYLTIPNKEILTIFTDMFKKWNQNLIDNDTHKKIFYFLWNKKPKEAQELLCNHLKNTISFYDNVEAFYHGFFLDFCSRTKYIVKSNREAGSGRCDLYIQNNNEKEMIIFELKWTKYEKDLEKYANIAINQIISKKYYDEFIYDYKKILCYGISFSCKKCFISFKSIEEKIVFTI